MEIGKTLFNRSLCKDFFLLYVLKSVNANYVDYFHKIIGEDGEKNKEKLEYFGTITKNILNRIFSQEINITFILSNSLFLK